MTRSNSSWKAVLSASAAMLMAMPALAQQAESQTPPPAEQAEEGEIVVTALKSGSVKLDRVPLAIQAFTGDTLKRRNVRDGADLIQLIPGASQAQEIGAGYRIFSFRGSGAGGPIGDGLIGYYLDETPFGVPNNQAAPPVQYFDIDRVEVLRGPQGTLYGLGSSGGTIIYHTKNPDLERVTTAGEAEISTTRDTSELNYRAAAAVSVPLVPGSLGLRVSGGYDRRAGTADIYSGAPTGTPRARDANEVRAKDIQAVLLWQPDALTTVRLRGWYFSTDQDYLNVLNSVNPPFASFQGDVVGYDKRRAYYISNTITRDVGQFTITNATSFQRSLPGGFAVGLNLGAPLGIGTLINGGDANNFVNELRIATSKTGPFHGVAGVFYQKAKGLYTFSLNFPTLALSGNTITRTENAALFSEASYELFGGKLVPLVGLRYFKDTRSSDSLSNGDRVFSRATPDALTWRANLAYYPAKDWMVFFNSGTGFRSGILQSKAQADAVIADGVPSALSLSPDKLRNLELGMKGSMFDGALRVAISLYDIKYTNIQSAFNTSIGLSAFANLGDGKSQGIDIETTWRTPLKGLALSLVGNINDSTYTNVIPAYTASDRRIANGTRLLNTPPHNFRLDANYDRKVGSVDLFATASATAVGRARNGDATVNTLNPYQLYQASIGVRFDRYEVRLFGDNLSDERGPTAANGPTLLAGPRPRTIGLTFRMNAQ
ncbi:TonB-dependent receptor [Sphingomonas pokkalii]|uniref:TonB-dependent receptor n=1 Tax=Sphingomonas pokkalii TaxID=2175090 RepID=A0A2U0SGN4_9SPHN|nr:TonB-dependent receptor [Sphingomonas pokkalii]PVX30519.1 TonB-dependent receptor [Sphingomonas pokkalii]